MIEPRWCQACACFTYNDDHVCTVYDGPPCKTCGEPTVFYTLGAPGVGSGRQCRRGHDEHLTPHRILTPDETR